MGAFRLKTGWTILAWLSAAIIVGLNVKLVFEEVASAYASFPEYSTLFNFLLLPLLIFAALVLLYITFVPFFIPGRRDSGLSLHGDPKALHLRKPVEYACIAVAVDFSVSDNEAIGHALRMAGKETSLILIHSVETAGAIMLGREIMDKETAKDAEALAQYVRQVSERGVHCTYKLCYGRASSSIPQAVIESGADLLVMAAHGHRGLKDVFLGTTIDKVRHRLNIAVHIVNNR
jgi:manganese transport protein